MLKELTGGRGPDACIDAVGMEAHGAGVESAYDRVRTAQQHGQNYLPRLLEHVSKGELDPSFLATHRFPLADAVKGYELFKKKQDGCVRAVFLPN